MTDIRAVPIFPGDISAIRAATYAVDLSWSHRNLLAQVVERYNEATEDEEHSLAASIAQGAAEVDSWPAWAKPFRPDDNPEPCNYCKQKEREWTPVDAHDYRLARRVSSWSD